ncbi:hypothetical protein JCM30471_26470 [Desulfuromonas carbonis]|uniref:sensor histidine kinase n=1 Tax=Desulfuromonas sp. DDH964 TaxID=1823759 RepID=UPI00078E3799|nr:ATP-binding protein [Desulfuromonas sp. DDH964]AMV70839.1 sensor histidine kinase, HAMP domain-containing [Desulfuromonas sp. DDH964]
MKQRLLWKLLLINLPVVLVILAVVWLAIDHLAAGYFMVLMDKYMVSPTETHHAFLTAIHETLIWASLAALLLAFVLSFLLTRRVLQPLAAMTAATREVAAGNFAARVTAVGSDEVAEVAAAFNRMADALERLEALRKTMVADVAHELRTPLTNLRGYLEGLADGILPPERETLVMLQQETLRLVHLVDDLGQLARADAARAYLRREPVDLPAAVTQLLRLDRPRFEGRGLTVTSRFAPGTEWVAADRDKLLQALRNLLENAWKYTPVNGQVAVSAERVAAGVRVTVANSGSGIPAADLPFIFERFYRADPSRSRAAGGAGIGLAIVKELIEAHGGTVGAESSAGQTCVWFVLPAATGR